MVSTVEGGSGASIVKGEGGGVGGDLKCTYTSCRVLLDRPSSQTSELELRFVNLGSALISYL